MIQWGWIDGVAELARRLRNLEEETKKTTVNDVHEIETMPCIAQDNSSTDMRQTHNSANANKVFVTPFKFSGQIALRRLSLVCSSTAGNNTDIGLCLYALNDFSRVDIENPRSRKNPILQKVLAGQWLNVDGADHQRLNVEYTRTPLISTANALYYAAWTTSNQEGRVFCANPVPGSIDASKSFRGAFLTDGTASTGAAFPDTLTIVGDATTPATPCVVGRSRVGIRVFGSFTDD